jgi:hypothetical protein
VSLVEPVGLRGMPRQVYTCPANMGWTLLNQIASVGYVFLFVSVLLFLWNVVNSLREGKASGRNPTREPCCGLAYSCPFAHLSDSRDRRTVIQRTHAAARDHDHGICSPGFGVASGGHLPLDIFAPPSFSSGWLALGRGDAMVSLLEASYHRVATGSCCPLDLARSSAISGNAHVGLDP